MFHQVRVPSNDRDFLRFFWWLDGDINNAMVEYRMTVHLFGATSSPSCASFALKLTAKENKDKYQEEVINTVYNNFYVDDCLRSIETTKNAISLYKDLVSLCALGGFRLTKWISNSKKVVAAIPEEERAKVKHMDIDKEHLPVERALGVQWNVEEDTFNFKLALKSQPVTRRGILSVVSSVYDPLGFLSPVILIAKQVLQDLCRTKCGWDASIPTSHAEQWQKWLNELPELYAFQVKRSLIPEGFGNIKSAQMHHFCDASEIGYGSVSYLRLVDYSDNVHVTFLMGKAPESQWPKDTLTKALPPDDPEVKKDLIVCSTIMPEENPLIKFIGYFSSWTKLQRSVAWILKLKSALKSLSTARRKLNETHCGQAMNAKAIDVLMHKVRANLGRQPLSVEDMAEAEKAVLRFEQKQHFSEEIAALEKGKDNVGRASSIYKLDPRMVGGILRVGRLRRTSMRDEEKYPAILPKNGHVSVLLLRHMHEQNITTMTRKMLKGCITCRRLHAKVTEQKMSDLPKDRVSSDHPPFSHVGVDYFGPILVKRGRGQAKRYGVLFTCLTSRAVHLKVAESLDTDSCINALRRSAGRQEDAGNKFSMLPIFFGEDGRESTCLFFKSDKNGTRK
ncbi:hypothetical protein N1851_026997 [Merluccius polli]|uniref:Integrase zinc-binding domain-containing protein n=1 Tax=Merluccius polli TaxID=89951 RepID=A0AA47MAZ1_MERPO|nr:hypothetical protein N1851_026997 [Merluccius polli]